MSKDQNVKKTLFLEIVHHIWTTYSNLLFIIIRPKLYNGLRNIIGSIFFRSSKYTKTCEVLRNVDICRLWLIMSNTFSDYLILLYALKYIIRDENFLGVAKNSFTFLINILWSENILNIDIHHRKWNSEIILWKRKCTSTPTIVPNNTGGWFSEDCLLGTIRRGFQFVKWVQCSRW